MCDLSMGTDDRGVIEAVERSGDLRQGQVRKLAREVHS